MTERRKADRQDDLFREGRPDDFVFGDEVAAEWFALDPVAQARVFVEAGVPEERALAAATLGFVVTDENRHLVPAADIEEFEERALLVRRLLDGYRDG